MTNMTESQKHMKDKLENYKFKADFQAAGKVGYTVRAFQNMLARMVKCGLAKVRQEIDGKTIIFTSPKKNKRIAIDFDGVLHSYVSGWKGAEVIPDPPVAGAIEAVTRYLVSGFDVAVYSARARTPEGIGAIYHWLERTGFPADGIKIWSHKPPATIYIDDRGYCFRGEFPSAEFIQKFEPWKQ